MSRSRRKAKARDQALDLVTLVYPRELDRRDGAEPPGRVAGRLRRRAARRARRAPGEAPPGASRRSLGRDRRRRCRRWPRASRAGSARRSSGSIAWSSGRPWSRCRPAAGPTPASGPRRRGRSRSGWSPARCEKRPDAATYRAIADRLSARALEAARRQADNLIDAGDGPRAGRDRPGPRRPQGCRGRLGPDARPGHARRSGPDPTTPPRSGPVRSRPAAPLRLRRLHRRGNARRLQETDSMKSGRPA